MCFQKEPFDGNVDVERKLERELTFMCLGKHAAYNRVIETCGGTFKVDLLFRKPTRK